MNEERKLTRTARRRRRIVHAQEIALKAIGLLLGSLVLMGVIFGVFELIGWLADLLEPTASRWLMSIWS